MITDDDTHEPHHESSATATLLDELALYGHRPFSDEPDSRPLPEEAPLRGALADIFDALVSSFTDTRLEPDLDDLLWSTVNIFHRAGTRIERELDTNEQAQRRSQREQDGSEVKSVILERLVDEGLTLIERRNAFEFMRDAAADLYETHTLHHWRPHAGSMVNRKALTSAMIDSRDFIAARRRAETEVMLPAGSNVAFTGGTDFNDVDRIYCSSRPGCIPNTPTWCCSTGAAPRVPRRSPPAGPTAARWRRWRSSPTGRATPRPLRSSATTSCSTRCRLVSWCSPAPASPTT